MTRQPEITVTFCNDEGNPIGENVKYYEVPAVGDEVYVSFYTRDGNGKVVLSGTRWMFVQARRWRRPDVVDLIVDEELIGEYMRRQMERMIRE